MNENTLGPIQREAGKDLLYGPPPEGRPRGIVHRPHLVIAAFWTDYSHDEATTHVADSLDGLAIKGSGAVVSVKAPDARLAAFLRDLQLEEAADFEAGEVRE